MKRSKKNFVAIVLIVLLLALAVGYAAFSQTLPISGTANASGNWDIKFVDGTETITNSIVEGTTANTAEVAADGKSMNVTVNLATPGDGANVTVDITNAGNVAAVLKKFNVTGDGFSESTTNTYKNGPILVKVPTVTIGDELAAGATKTFTFSVEWDSTQSTSLGADGKTATFTITFDYEQKGVTGTYNESTGYTDKN